MTPKNAAALWKRYLDWLYYHEELGLYLDISRMEIDDALRQSLAKAFESAFAAMDALEKGEIANPDENRMVGHYWLRDPDLAPTAEIAQEIRETVARIETFATAVHNGSIKPAQGDRFTDILSIGIGGSALGPQFVAAALAPDSPPLAIHFIDNTDPEGIDQTLRRLGDRLATTLVITISKSGGTPETHNGMVEVKHCFQQRGLDFASQAVAITGLGSQLSQQAKAEGWLNQFPMPDWVGGRTSELSAVGLLSAALQGIAIRELLAGAKAMDAVTRLPQIHGNPAAMLALCWYAAGNGRGEKDMVVLPYKDRLLLFSRYLQQLVMESLGKEKDLNGQVVHQGIAVYGNKGSTDQHAYVQQLREGVPNFFLTFIEVLHDRPGPSIELEPGITSGDYLSGFLQGTRQALYEKQRGTITVTIPEVTPKTVGGLIALYERAVGLYASLININAYHQPGVEAGKKAAASVLSLQKQILQLLQTESQPLTLAEVAEKVDAAEQVEQVYLILRHLDANHRGVKLEGDRSKPDLLTVTAL